MKQERIAVKNIVLVHGGFVDGSEPHAVAALIETAAKGSAAKAA